MIQRIPMSSNYLTVIHGLFEMYRLAKEGKFESPEADAIRDAIDEPWALLTDAERERARELSMGLNAIIDRESLSDAEKQK
ncbi:MAG: hypothetical protein HYR84_13650 [Planctomycetes bacterium]|nr:hypothetical protein [Planctomycetota bacterium]